ncbi:hypothetical protein [Mucilaginibacter sp.]
MFFVILVYLIPFVQNLIHPLDVIGVFKNDQDGFTAALLRSGVFAVLTAVLLTGGALIFSILLIKVELRSKKSLLLNLLLMPVILGNVSSSFIWKIITLDSDFLFASAGRKFFGVGLMELWQYGPLFIYLFWLNLLTVKSQTWDYARAIDLSPFEKIKDIILPHQRNMAILLYVICFIFCFYEEAKIEFIFRGSRGTNTEMVNHWLNRTYQSDSLLSADYAFRHISQVGLLVLILALCILVGSLLLKAGLYRLLITTKKLYFGSRFNYPVGIAYAIMALLLVFVCYPLVAALVRQAGNLSFDLAKLLFPLSLTLIAAVLASLLAIVFGIMSRLAWQQILSSFNYRSMLFLILMFTLLIVPPIIILISGFKWMQNVGYSSTYNIDIAWLVGHCILSFPLLAGFAVATHFRAKNNYINYLEAHSVSFREKIRDIFLIPITRLPASKPRSWLLTKEALTLCASIMPVVGCSFLPLCFLVFSTRASCMSPNKPFLFQTEK